MIRKQLKAGQLFTYHRHVYQVTKRPEGLCPLLNTMLVGFLGLCVICKSKMPHRCYPKLIK